MTLTLSVDRIENGVAVCYDDHTKYHIPAEGLFEGAMISAEFDADGNLISASVLTEETENRKKQLADRSKNLFKRNKK
jgi:hypothetical protein